MVRRLISVVPTVVRECSSCWALSRLIDAFNCKQPKAYCWEAFFVVAILQALPGEPSLLSQQVVYRYIAAESAWGAARDYLLLYSARTNQCLRADV